jgi:hypothetical protein
MSNNDSQTKSGFRLSLDGWAVLIAFALALAVKLGILKNIPW